MSKYDNLWVYIKSSQTPNLEMSFEDIKNVCGFEIDHSFLKYKKELIDYGYEVVKISMKEKFVAFRKID